MMSRTRTLGKLASPFLYTSGAYLRRWSRHARQRPFTVVLIYHRVVSSEAPRTDTFGIERGVSARVFESQIRFMLKHFSPIKSSQVLEPSSEPLRFVVTLDDGYEDNFLVAAPILRRLSVPATFYVVSDYVGTDRLFWWEQLAHMMRASNIRNLNLQHAIPDLVDSDELPALVSLQTNAEREAVYERLCAALRAGPHAKLHGRVQRLSEALEVRPADEGRDYGLMNWSQLRQLVHQDFEIGGHTATHCNVVGLDDDDLHTELTSSIATIERQVEAPVLTFAYPYGQFKPHDNSVAKALKDAGCRLGFTAVKGVVNGQTNPFELPRSHLNRRYHFACAYNVQDALSQH